MGVKRKVKTEDGHTYTIYDSGYDGCDRFQVDRWGAMFDKTIGKASRLSDALEIVKADFGSSVRSIEET